MKEYKPEADDEYSGRGLVFPFTITMVTTELRNQGRLCQPPNQPEKRNNFTLKNNTQKYMITP